MSKKYILILFSSANPTGNTAQLVSDLTHRLSHHRVKFIDIDQLNFAHYNYPNHYPKDDPFYDLAHELDKADHLVFASPVYWYAVTANMKKLVDRMTELTENPTIKPIGKRLKGKHAWVVTTSASEQKCEVFAGFFSRLFAYFALNQGGLLHINCRDKYVIDEPALSHFVTKLLAVK
ncbi:NAD(P)H-dependent oxidoreductase [Pseudoalteromonas tunicata]|uniref:flavodoxin family protein n=1 Tax=Pseudoalteromonas tunicata TaxID=314281 RepID=UPI00273DC757|nr:NAD(P)H-dependent oxidoreductase [Pseudoalteromonas tunicata]MDP5212858.1 NAD(P)H-dependent oxidoreductase [Pseudoalteromonas tunicata]